MHKNQIAHRDIKAENIIFMSKKSRDMKVKLIDFGTAQKKSQSNEYMTQSFGSPYYMAPEVVRGCYNEQCDVWSIGILLHILLTGQPPFIGTNSEIFE